MKNRRLRPVVLCSVVLLSATACGPAPVAPQLQPTATASPSQAPAKATVAEADAFVKRYNEEGSKLALEFGKAMWVMNTHITADTNFLSSKARERWINFHNGMIAESKRFNDLALTGATGRAMKLIKQGVTMPAPQDKAKVAELAGLSSELKSIYGKGKYCKADDPKDCRDLEKLMDVMAKSRSYDELLDVWTGWRTISPPMRTQYTRFAAIMNEGAKELGFDDTGSLWKSGYDMSGPAFEAEADRLWQQVKPLYDQVHCYVRGRLSQHYGVDKVPLDKPIPAHLLGNMWAQEWGHIFDLVKPYNVRDGLDITRALARKKYDSDKMVRSAEAFYTSVGLRSLPKSFYERSMFTKPRDREVVCHASAWDIDLANDDLRIKMCIDPNEEDLTVIYHELGHIYYYIYYKDQPLLFQSGAHDGFHEAIGDALTLSMTPGYYKKAGFIKDYKTDEKALINYQMKMALDKIAFLPFGKLIDQWRWDVFSGKTTPDNYNAAWWALRTKYQGIAAPVKRTEANFDPGAKYHIPANTPYTRYFLARILQFQFHQAMCKAAGNTGPLHACSIYGSEAAGKKLSAMLALGQSRPWPEALEQLTGTRKMDASAIIDYFAPLMKWLAEENKGKKCGW